MYKKNYIASFHGDFIINSRILAIQVGGGFHWHWMWKKWFQEQFNLTMEGEQFINDGQS